ncbi:MAG TPA: helix-turn-helix transcriptional regulator [Candidatus Saccharimonadia bacterium]|nr:helix-turn-helix transcriptional regulator [Candidatus Saccharimonadia bacterium]
MEGFGQRVVAARGKHGWTRRELAKRAGLHEQHLANVERGNRQHLEAETIIKLARALGCTTDHLLGVSDEEDQDEESSARFATAAR